MRYFALGKTAVRETYRKEQEARTKRRKIEEARAREVTIPSKSQMDQLLSEVDAHADLDEI